MGAKFEIGDVVYLKSDLTRPLSVQDYETVSEVDRKKYGEARYSVVWFNAEDTCHLAAFFEKQLIGAAELCGDEDATNRPVN